MAIYDSNFATLGGEAKRFDSLAQYFKCTIAIHLMKEGNRIRRNGTVITERACITLKTASVAIVVLLDNRHLASSYKSAPE